MAKIDNVPLTSIEILQQQSHGFSLNAGSKRPFKEISSADRLIYSHPSTVTTLLDENSHRLPFSKSRPSTSESSRLTESRICNTHHEYPECKDETARPRLQAPLQPSSSANPLLTLSHFRYGLPESLIKNFALMGIQHIYPWQSSCLLGRGLLTGEKNLVYTAPTGGGKSLVADVLMLKRILESPRTKAILVLPYVALVQEKVNWLRKAVEGVERDLQLSSQLPNSKHSKWRTSTSVRVVGFFGGSKTRATWGDVDIAVCTFEKAHIISLESTHLDC